MKENIMVTNLEPLECVILVQITTRHVFVKHGCPQRQQSQNMAKSLSPTF